MSRRCCGASWQRQKADPERLDEAGCSERSRQREHRRRDRIQQVDERLGRHLKPVKQSLEREPLAREAIQRRKPRDRDGTDQEACASHGHPSQQSPELFDLARAGRDDDAPGAEEQQALEDRVIQYVIETRGDADRRETRLTTGHGNHAGSDTQQDDADVLDAVIRQQPFEIVLHERIQHAQHGRHASHDENEHTPRQLAVSPGQRRRIGRCRRCRS